MDIHDQATEWANTHQDDPRAQDILAKAWATKNPTDPRSQAILERLNAPVDKLSEYLKAKGTVGEGYNSVNPAQDVVTNLEQEQGIAEKRAAQMLGAMAGPAAGKIAPAVGSAALAAATSPTAQSIGKHALGYALGGKLTKFLGL